MSEMYEVLTQASIMALLSLVVAVIPMVMGVVYAIRPTEMRLALMRPLSLASLFAGFGGSVLGFINVLRSLSMSPLPAGYQNAILGGAEAFVPAFVAFGCLTVGWLCVAYGMTRQT